jgi:hypothetical protein
MVSLTSRRGGKMRIALAVTGVVCLAFVLMGSTCKTGAADYWPMAEGNTWTYREVEIVAYPDSTPDSTIVEEAVTWKFRSRVKLADGADAWQMDGGGGDSSYNYFSDSKSAVLLYTDLLDTKPDTWLVLPLEQGKTWTFGSVTMLVRGKETVEVPAGTYDDCWKVEMQTALSPSFVWFAPNVGMVLMESRSEYGNLSFVTRRELTHAEVK